MATILLIDDDEGLLDVLALSFEDAGHDVLTAADGTRGLALVEQRAPALVISDVNMPGVDGFSLCRRLREAGNLVPRGADRGAGHPAAHRVAPRRKGPPRPRPAHPARGRRHHMQLATLVQLIYVAAPIIPEVTVFDGGLDRMLR